MRSIGPRRCAIHINTVAYRAGTVTNAVQTDHLSLRKPSKVQLLATVPSAAHRSRFGAIGHQCTLLLRCHLESADSYHVCRRAVVGDSPGRCNATRFCWVRRVKSMNRKAELRPRNV